MAASTLTARIDEWVERHRDRIIGLAQDFVGSNNINLLFPSGQFGTRLQGGKDAASARWGAAGDGRRCRDGGLCFLEC